MMQVLTDAFDYLIEELRDEFFKLHPEHIGKVRLDALNNSQRVFKTIFSIHKSLDYVVIPLDPENIIIDFEKAAIPLKSEVIKSAETWYVDYDNGGWFLDNCLKPYLRKAKERRDKKPQVTDSEFKRSSIPIEDIDKWPACMRNLYILPECKEGQTRALAVFVSFLGQIGIEESMAYNMFDELATRWGARKSNIFEKYFLKMKVPSCSRLISDDNTGFPKGVSIKRLGVCNPDARCLKVPSPYYYADKVGNTKRLLTPVSEISKAKTAKKSTEDKNQIERWSNENEFEK
jgi:hypothetical protein